LRRVLELTAEAFAFAGGAVLVAMIGMSAASIVGRSVFGAPVRGDFELVQLGCAIGISAFLPWCQMRRGNIIVDFFTAGLPARAQAALDAVGALLLGLVMALVAWRATEGAMTVWASGERGMISRVPQWIGYAAIVPPLALTAHAGMYNTWEYMKNNLKLTG
jgi:TRAP-type C4-dicarboxylate transport system permease small subunit